VFCRAEPVQESRFSKWCNLLDDISRTVRTIAVATVGATQRNQIALTKFAEVGSMSPGVSLIAKRTALEREELLKRFASDEKVVALLK